MSTQWRAFKWRKIDSCTRRLDWGTIKSSSDFARLHKQTRQVMQSHQLAGILVWISFDWALSTYSATCCILVTAFSFPEGCEFNLTVLCVRVFPCLKVSNDFIWCHLGLPEAILSMTILYDDFVTIWCVALVVNISRLLAKTSSFWIPHYLRLIA